MGDRQCVLNISSSMGPHGKGFGNSCECDLSDPMFASVYFGWAMDSVGTTAAPNDGIDYWWRYTLKVQD